MGQEQELEQTLKHPQGVKQLCLGGMKLHSLPPEFGLLRDLEELDLGWAYVNTSHNEGLHFNEFNYIPPVLERLSKLRVLDLSGNPLSQAQVEAARKRMPGCQILFKTRTEIAEDLDSYQRKRPRE